MYIIDPFSRTPVYEQIVRQTERFIAMGVMKPSEPVSSVRTLASVLAINPNTIVKSYTELTARGILCAVPGKGYFVAPDAISILAKREAEKLDDLYRLTEQIALAGVDKNDIRKTVEHAISAALQQRGFDEEEEMK